MRAFKIGLVALGFAASALAQPGGTIRLAPEETVTIQLDPADNQVETVERGRAQWSPLFLAAARQLAGQPIPDKPVPTASPMPPVDGLAAPPPVAKGTLRLHLLAIAGQHGLLVVENGYDRALVYRARLTEHRKTRATDVCLVMPGTRSFEHWPHTIERLELRDFRLVDWDEEKPIPCR